MVLRHTPSRFLFLAMPRTAQICNSTSSIQVRHPPALKQSWYGNLALRCHCLVLHHGSQVSYVLCLPQHTELGIWIPSISIKHRSSISSCVVWVSLFTSHWPWGNSTKGSCTTARKVLVPQSHTHQWLGTLRHIVRANPGDSTVPSPSQGSSFLSAGRFWQKKRREVKRRKSYKNYSTILGYAKGKDKCVFNAIRILLFWTVIRRNQRIPFSASVPTAGKFAVGCTTALAQYRRPFILML